MRPRARDRLRPYGSRHLLSATLATAVLVAGCSAGRRDDVAPSRPGESLSSFMPAGLDMPSAAATSLAETLSVKGVDGVVVRQRGPLRGDGLPESLLVVVGVRDDAAAQRVEQAVLPPSPKPRQVEVAGQDVAVSTSKQSILTLHTALWRPSERFVVVGISFGDEKAATGMVADSIRAAREEHRR